MEGRRKKVLIGILLVGIVLVIAVWAIRAYRVNVGQAEAREIFEGRVDERICEETLEIMSMPRGQWIALGCNDDNKFKNPKTGKYTMMEVARCESCREKIPLVVIQVPEGMTLNQAMVYIMQEERKLICPKCGKPVYALPGS